MYRSFAPLELFLPELNDIARRDKSSIVTKAFIQGRDIDLNDKHKQLNERYKKKYNINN